MFTSTFVVANVWDLLPACAALCCLVASTRCPPPLTPTLPLPLSLVLTSSYTCVALCSQVQLERGSQTVKAHTCKARGGLLHLPEYESKGALREGLLKSITWSSGYTEF